MANYATLKAAINAVIKANGNKEITGTVLNETLTAMVNSLGADYQFAGVATPSTNPGTPDQNVFYLATQTGLYPNFGGLVIDKKALYILSWNGAWDIDDALGLDDIYEDYIQQFIELLEEYQPIVIQGNVTNAPDEEDLTSVDQGGTDVLKFKNKAFLPAYFTGLGRIYLRKNIVDGKNLLTQAMISDANTIYHIQYDYELAEDITIPAGCVLKFEGGSISNGNIFFNNTVIKAGSYEIFNNVEYDGKIANSVNVVWFGAIGDDTSDSTDAFKKAMRNGKTYNNNYCNTILVPAGKYQISDTLVLRKGDTICGDGRGNTWLKNTTNSNTLIRLASEDSGGYPCIIKELFLYGLYGNCVDTDGVPGWQIQDCWITSNDAGIKAAGADGLISNCIFDQGTTAIILSGHSIIIDNCDFYALTYACFIIVDCGGAIISNCHLYYTKQFGISIEQPSENIQINNCQFVNSDNSDYFVDANTHIITQGSGRLVNSIISSCVFLKNKNAAITISNGKNIKIDNCSFKISDKVTIRNTGGDNTIISNCCFDNVKYDAIIANLPVVVSNNIFVDVDASGEDPVYYKVCILVTGPYSGTSFVTNNVCRQSEIAVASFVNSSINNLSSCNKCIGGNTDIYKVASDNTHISYNETVTGI